MVILLVINKSNLQRSFFNDYVIRAVCLNGCKHLLLSAFAMSLGSLVPDSVDTNISSRIVI